jgi:hypothetical protein
MTLREALARLQADPVTAAREKLRETQLAQRQRQEALEAAVNVTERTAALANSVAVAEAEVTAAESAARAATRNWAVGGASATTAACEPEALARVERAHRALADSKHMAEGAQAAVPELERAELEARAALSGATADVGTAVTAVLVAMVEPNFAKLERARAAYLAALAPLQAVGQLFDIRWGVAHRWAGFRRSEDFLHRLADLTISSGELSPAELDQRSDEWAKFGRELANDPDASI